MDPGHKHGDSRGYAQQTLLDSVGFKNAEILLSEARVLENIQLSQRKQNLPQSKSLTKTKIASINLDIEMETGTGKTYCYIKTIFEMNIKFGWTKFIIVVPSIAIREGVKQSFENTADHFQESYTKKIKFFIYNSKQLHNVESFSSDSGINVMIINYQAFNAAGKDNQRIHQSLDDFQSRRPIDVIKANNPILILDEPQKMEAKKTSDSLNHFNPLFILRYSATHKTQHNLVHRLDAIDAFNQKLVKKIHVRGITTQGLAGTNAYLYLEGIEISKKKPIARLEIEIMQQSGPKRSFRRLQSGDNLYELSGEMDQYKEFIISEIDDNTKTVEFTNGHQIQSGTATGDINEKVVREIQIRESIKAHLEKEQILFLKGIKVLSLFFIDTVSKYRIYEDSKEQLGEYGTIFEEQYILAVDQLLQDSEIDRSYKKYLQGIQTSSTHKGYFSIDKNKRLIDPLTATEIKKDLSNDVDAYNLILKDKEALLSFEEPTRFIFSHSALREGWDNPNVFVICTLKQSDNNISRRQEVGRGLRIAVNQLGVRQDDPATVHETNILTVVASESYKDFVTALQADISETLSQRPRSANAAYFTGKVLQLKDGLIEVDHKMAKEIEFYLIQNKYIDLNHNILPLYIEDAVNKNLAVLPENLEPLSEQIQQLIDTVYTDVKLPTVVDDRAGKVNYLNSNFKKAEFLELWNRINHKAVFKVNLDTLVLTRQCVTILNNSLQIKALKFSIQTGEQKSQQSQDQITSGDAFKLKNTSNSDYQSSIHSAVKYDLVGKIAAATKLTRKTIANILSLIQKDVFAQFKLNPESFIAEAIRLIQEQKSSALIEHLTYDTSSEKYNIDIFSNSLIKQDFTLSPEPLQRHIYDYVVTESQKERSFVNDLDVSSEVAVYAKLPKAFNIPTPVGTYNPDWAIAFNEGHVKHIYFIAETKGSIASSSLRGVEKIKIECARKFFDKINEINDSKKVKYDVVDSYERLQDLLES